MSIFDSIRNAIFGHASGAAAKPAQAPSAAQPTTINAGSGQAPAPRSPAPQSPVDVEATLDGLARKSGQKLNWRTSIVDLMKLLDLDSSLEHRKALATELGYTGSTQDSAAMNIWLHKEVMAKLAANGAKVPASLH